MTMLKSKLLTNKMAELAKGKTILDIGGANRFQKSMAQFKELFANTDYISCDIDASKKPDVICDAHQLLFKNGEFDGVICIAVLEHVKDPFKVVSEMRRVLKEGGKAIIYVPFVHPYHGAASCGDYWRFTNEGIRQLFKDFTSVEIEQDGGLFTAFAVFTRQQWLNTLWSVIDKLVLKFNIGRTSTKGYFVYVIK